MISLLMLGQIAMAVLAVLLALRVPVAVAVGGVALAGLAMAELLTGAGLGQTVPALAVMLRDVLHPQALATVVLFVLLGNIAFYAGISTRIYDAAAVWLRSLPGGLAIASVMGCGGFAAISGSSIACASTMGRICVPEMLQHGYDPRLATSSVAVGGTLGSLIPPSILFILYGLLSDVPIAHLFIAGILPGLLSLAGMVVVILWWVRDEPGAAPAAGPAEASRAEAVMALWPFVLLLAVIVGGLFWGALSPVAAAAICVGLALAIGLGQGRLTMGHVLMVIRESAVQSAGILIIVVVARVFMGFAELTGIGAAVTGWAQASGFSALTIVAIAAILYLIAGMFIEPLGILALTLPILLPLAQSYGLDLVWFGVIVVKLLEIALITPPVGLNVFVIASVSRGVAMERIFAGVARFLMVDVLVLVALILFPAIAILLPGMMTP